MLHDSMFNMLGFNAACSPAKGSFLDWFMTGKHRLLIKKHPAAIADVPEVIHQEGG